MDFSICVTRVNTLHPVFPDKTGFSRPEHPDPVVYNEHEGSALSPHSRLASWYLGTATASFCETNRGKCSVACGDRCHGNGMPEINGDS
ncbi:hypothetical protein CDAR_276691 [Caerostris darwini]|uniref:Uncharacterized protein n=1 Tax=Caerostris darwini TaxID=1538125 RepID=A0AAV4PIY4_9ARAC|nr:hypothetical protein CDAR_276691 [Caerostris darwini]